MSVLTPSTTLSRTLLRLPRTLLPSSSLFLRQYHDPAHPTPHPYPPTETAILSAALARVPATGFTTTTLTLGARDAGLLDVSTNLLPHGVFDLVRFHLATRRLALRDEVQFLDEAAGAETLDVAGRVRTLMWARLRANEPVLGRLPEALAIMAQPTHLPASLAELAALADEIWHLAGDPALDASWYAKRAGAAATYAAAEVYMTRDTSPGFVDTRRFLDDRLEELRATGTVLRDVGEWLGYAGRNLVNVARSRGVRI